jgi:hypothetical protein
MTIASPRSGRQPHEDTMSESYTNLLYHIVFSAKERGPLIITVFVMIRCRPFSRASGCVVDVFLGLTPQALCYRLLTQAR